MREDRPIFVVGAPRTGTTLLKEVLNRHPQIHLFDEVHFFERIWDDRKHPPAKLNGPHTQPASLISLHIYQRV